VSAAPPLGLPSDISMPTR